MASRLVRQIPNTLTTLRLLLAVPICVLVLRENYEAVLWVALAAGLSDGVDGWLARKLDATSHYGAVVDPLADKLMLSGIYACLAAVGLIPWWVALLVIGRDVIIVLGALLYQALYGRYAMEPSVWGKGSTFLQILFALMVLVQQVWPRVPDGLLSLALWAVVMVAALSGGHYVATWGLRAYRRAGRDTAD